MKVLVIDDDSQIGKMLGRFLSNRGYEVTFCKQGEHALEIYQKERHPLVITDIMMPNINGYEVCQRIRALSEEKLPVILAITAYDTLNALEGMLEAGADDYITKPLNFKSLDVRLKIAEKQVQCRQEVDQTNLALRKSEERLRLILENSQDILYSRNLQKDRYEYLGPAIAAIWGYTVDEFMNLNTEDILALIHPDDVQHVIDLVQETKTKAAKLNYTIEYRIKDRERGYRWVSDHITVVKNDDGIPIFRVGSVRDITERKKIEEKYRLLAENSSDLISMFRNEDLVYVSPAVENLLGYSPEELLQINHLNLIHPDDVDSISQNIKYRIENKITEHTVYIYRQRHKNGTYRWLETIDDRKIFEGEDVITILTTRDATDRVEAEQKLRASEERYRLLVENLGEGVGFVDPNEKIIFVNSEAHQIFGVAEGELIGRNIKEFTDLEMLAVLETQTNQRKSGQKGVYEYTITRPGGEKREILITATPQFDENHQYIGAFGIFRDITEQKRAQMEVLRVKAHLQFLLSASPVVIYTCKLPENGCEHTFISENVTSIFGYEPKDYLENPNFCRGHIHEEDCQHIFESVPQLYEQGFCEHEYRFLHKDGHYVWVHDKLRLVRNANGQPIEIVGSLTDITDRKKAELGLQKSEQVLRELNEAKDKFFSIVAHDLKSPFSAFLGISDILSGELEHLNQDRIKRLAERLNESANRLYKLLENLLDWSRVQIGTIQFNPQKIDLRRLIFENLYFLKSTAVEKNITLSANIDEKILIHADENMIETVLRNLISNAIKFTYDGGSVEVTTSEEGDFIKVCVIDSGVGITPENLKKLFRIDAHLTTSGTLGEKGTGLGLILAKEFIEKHGGTITVESKVDQGSIFQFTIPKFVES